MWALILIAIGLGLSHGKPDNANMLIGYDCDNVNTRLTTISLEGVASCPTPLAADIKTTESLGQVLQVKIAKEVQTYSCFIVESTFIYYCGMHSHLSIPMVPSVNTPIQLTRGDCELMQKTRKPSGISTTDYVELTRNGSTTYRMLLTGSIDNDGSCSGGTIVFQGQTYRSAVALRQTTIKLSDRSSVVDIKTGAIILPDGVEGRYPDGQVYDDEIGMTYWESGQEECSREGFELLYNGKINLVGELSAEAYTGALINIKGTKESSQPQFMFYGILKGQASTCGRLCYLTDYETLRVCFGDAMPNMYHRLTRPNVDLVRYMDAKVASLNLMFSRSLEEAFLKVSDQLCKQELEQLKNRLEVLKLAPNSGGLLTLGEKGHYGRQAGEVLHMVQCPPTHVALRPVTRCYLEIPVTHQNQSMFLTPHTRIITQHGTPIDCSVVAPPTFFIKGEWLSMTPQWRHEKTPIVLAPQVMPAINFRKLESFSHGGIYSQSDLDAVKTLISFPQRRKAFITNLMDGVSGKPMDQEYDLTKTFTPGSWSAIAKKNLQKVWGSFVGLGEVIAGLLGIFFIITIIRVTAGVLIRGYVSYKTVGCGWNVLAVLGSSCLHVAQILCPRERSDTVTTEEDDVETQAPARESFLEGYVATRATESSSRSNFYPLVQVTERA